jgi:hypothetical protein
MLFQENLGRLRFMLKICTKLCCSPLILETRKRTIHVTLQRSALRRGFLLFQNVTMNLYLGAMGLKLAHVWENVPFEVRMASTCFFIGLIALSVCQLNLSLHGGEIVILIEEMIRFEQRWKPRRK